MKTLIAIPAYESMPVGFVKSLVELQIPEGTTISIIPGTLIYEARNLIAQKAVENGFDFVLWLDADMIIPKTALIDLTVDIAAGRDFVTALYFRRRPPTNPVISNDFYWEVKEDGNVETGATSYVDYPRNAIFPIRGSGFGCCMTSVAMLRTLIDAYGSPFTPLMGAGEDYAFCYRARKAGYELFCDSRIKCGHIGSVIFDERAFLAQQGETKLPAPPRTCLTCEYGRTTICNDHGETIFNHKTQHCPEWRERIRREYET